MKNISLVFFILFSLTLSAQSDYQISNQLDFFRSNKIAKGEIKRTLTEADIKGSPYFNDDFINGNVYTTSKTMFSDIPLRLNIFNDQMEFKSPEGNIAAIATPEIIEKVTIEDHVWFYAPYSTAKKIKRGFLKLLVNGEAKLYVRPIVEFKDAVPPSGYKDAEPAQFKKQADTYYLRFGEEAAQLIENKKDLEKVFPDHKKEIAAFIKNNKINHRKEDKLKELVDYYNSL